MANVIQKYLRNEFETIEDYNEHAGEVAEPFRVLVVANFPSTSPKRPRRLVSIASSGPRCGVYTLVSVDTRLPVAAGFKLADLDSTASSSVWREDSSSGEKTVRPFPCAGPPPGPSFSRIVHIVGDGAKDASRVEVPFDFIARSPKNYWTSDSRGGVDVPLGRAGATKLQNLKLGTGTSQHVLIAGKTGSGKSTLMHALITNLALNTAPTKSNST